MTLEKKLQRTENPKDQGLSFPKFMRYFLKCIPRKFQQPGDKIFARTHTYLNSQRQKLRNYISNLSLALVQRKRVQTAADRELLAVS